MLEFGSVLSPFQDKGQREPLPINIRRRSHWARESTYSRLQINGSLLRKKFCCTWDSTSAGVRKFQLGGGPPMCRVSRILRASKVGCQFVSSLVLFVGYGFKLHTSSGFLQRANTHPAAPGAALGGRATTCICKTRNGSVCHTIRRLLRSGCLHSAICNTPVEPSRN